MGTEAIIVFILSGIVLVAGANFLSNLISHKSDNPQKRDPYECGMETIGPTWVQFKVGYYLFAILFLIFDVEVAFLVPWAVVFKTVGTVALVEILIFLIILGLGLLYAWKKQALKWE
ncbi:MAG: NADH-quinone oxidoreductase subunit A [Flavobacteriales bacterium CG03_land_8_20_14_0_80_35_15]|nr:NADH-quinone oxidoreductase subunit A [Zetaproteobacteria bacterium]NDK18683.1 NADH-quinone oxidoreductase subunit A [Flavobacteriales bacterium]OIO12548.1 MAG: NADH-quinone oxidoreductase subunit A [Flavobacteriaceae bacterium CG1_02_35_72]PIR13246.1 MAG: NADH-quinone oxidoreductase subunit A [Flavobacteriales bacterium CG11_big_fil_rev_8_21_14_0_20_35_7]PIV18287.1 MAG: NADH-quinone oxidoreductase subunit A [Flavobacteriales bacterium CG03_land_8_20_14_0_80_35_15]PIX07540.1 MAG: NADH-quino